MSGSTDKHPSRLASFMTMPNNGTSTSSLSSLVRAGALGHNPYIGNERQSPRPRGARFPRDIPILSARPVIPHVMPLVGLEEYASRAPFDPAFAAVHAFAPREAHSSSDAAAQARDASDSSMSPIQTSALPSSSLSSSNAPVAHGPSSSSPSPLPQPEQLPRVYYGVPPPAASLPSQSGSVPVAGTPRAPPVVNDTAASTSTPTPRTIARTPSLQQQQQEQRQQQHQEPQQHPLPEQQRFLQTMSSPVFPASLEASIMSSSIPVLRAPAASLLATTSLSSTSTRCISADDAALLMETHPEYHPVARVTTKTRSADAILDSDSRMLPMPLPRTPTSSHNDGDGGDDLASPPTVRSTTSPSLPFGVHVPLLPVPPPPTWQWSAESACPPSSSWSARERIQEVARRRAALDQAKREQAMREAEAARQASIRAAQLKEQAEAESIREALAKAREKLPRFMASQMTDARLAAMIGIDATPYLRMKEAEEADRKGKKNNKDKKTTSYTPSPPTTAPSGTLPAKQKGVASSMKPVAQSMLSSTTAPALPRQLLATDAAVQKDELEGNDSNCRQASTRPSSPAKEGETVTRRSTAGGVVNGSGGNVPSISMLPNSPPTRDWMFQSTQHAHAQNSQTATSPSQGAGHSSSSTSSSSFMSVAASSHQSGVVTCSSSSTAKSTPSSSSSFSTSPTTGSNTVSSSSSSARADRALSSSSSSSSTTVIMQTEALSNSGEGGFFFVFQHTDKHRIPVRIML